MKYRRLLALIKKEFLQIRRDSSTLLITVFLPTLLIFIYGFGVSLDINHLKIGMIQEDFSSDANSFVQSFIGSDYFQVTFFSDRERMAQELVRGGVRGAIVLPSYFSAFRKAGVRNAPIQVIADGSEANTASFVQNYVQAAWFNWTQQQNLTDQVNNIWPIRLSTRFWYNEELESRYFLIPGSIAIIMTLIGTLLTSLVVAREWERGTMEALLSTHVTRGEFIFGKFIPYFILALLSMALCAAFSVFVYSIPFRGSIVNLFLVSSAFLFSALGIGLLISTRTKNQFLASQIAMVIGFMPAFILSGFIFEISSMPAYIRWVTSFIPARYYVSSLLTLFLVGDRFNLILMNLIPMILIGALTLFLTFRNTSQRLN